jgi:hypothetical protein
VTRALQRSQVARATNGGPIHLERAGRFTRLHVHVS